MQLLIGVDDSIVGLDDGWNDFVQRQRVGSFLPASLGTRLAVEGATATALYELMRWRARSQHPVSLDIWAASPDRTTKVELALELVGEDVALRLAPLFDRRREPLRLFDRAAERGDDRVTVCGFCQRVRAFDWAEPETAIRQLRIRADGPQPQLAPGVCDDCERHVYAACGGVHVAA